MMRARSILAGCLLFLSCVFAGEASGQDGRYTCQEPLLNTLWGQTRPYNTYCISGRKPVRAGCSAIALAMILAHNEFPGTVDWQRIKAAPRIEYLDTLAQEQLKQLLGSIFNDVHKTTTSAGTMITPRQIRLQMEKMGYRNVRELSGPRLTEKMLEAISGMLADGKPVFLSAVPGLGKLSHGHAWVVDGATYSAEGEYLLHFNFGWRGECNGYYSVKGLNPTKAFAYDTPGEGNTARRHACNYRWHFRLLTYDLP